MLFSIIRTNFCLGYSPHFQDDSDASNYVLFGYSMNKFVSHMGRSKKVGVVIG